VVGDVVLPRGVSRAHSSAHKCCIDELDAFCNRDGPRFNITGEKVDNSRTPTPVFRISITASLALRMSGKRAVATVVGMTGVRRMVTSVMMPSVPSAPMNSFVVSNPADDLRERRLVLITSPDGRTTVYRRAQHSCLAGRERLTAFRNHSPLAVPYRTALAIEGSFNVGLE
jgi:hypothetical protein